MDGPSQGPDSGGPVNIMVAASCVRDLARRLVGGGFTMMLLGLPSYCSDTTVLAGLGYGPFRYFHEHLDYGSVGLMREAEGMGLGSWLSLDLSSKGTYLGLGPLLSVPIGKVWRVGLSTGPGWYSDQEALNLGSKLEFRTTAYVLHRLGRRYRTGLAVSHYSNGGIAYHNPGAETVQVFFGFSLTE